MLLLINFICSFYETFYETYTQIWKSQYCKKFENDFNVNYSTERIEVLESQVIEQVRKAVYEIFLSRMKLQSWKNKKIVLSKFNLKLN